MWLATRSSYRGEDKYKDKGGIPEAVFDKVEEVFKDLSMPKLLSRCLEGLSSPSMAYCGLFAHKQCLWDLPL